MVGEEQKMIGVGTFKISEKAKRYVNDVLTSERLSYGPYTKKFESVFAAAHNCRFAIMTNSGTCSLMIALAALKNRHGWQDGDEVIVPAVTFIATSNIVIQLNMKPVFVDVDPVYYELDPAKIEEKITSRTRCIIPVHLFGLPCDMDPIMKIAEKYKLRVIEDSCETMFTRYKGKSVGAFGDVGCFSTYIAHILTTGVGGLCTTNDPDLAIQLRSLMNHGRDSIYLSIDDDNNKSKEELEIITKRRFSFVQMGYSFRATEMEGALGLAEFEDREEMMRKRWENGKFLMEKLGRWSEHLQVPQLRPESGHAFMMFPIVMRKEPKAGIVNYLEENGIETRDMLPLINQPFYKKLYDLNEDDYPNAKWINNNGFYIASHQGLTDLEKKYILSMFEGYFLKTAVYKERAALVVMSKGTRQVARNLFDLLPLDQFQEKIFVEASEDTETPAFFAKKGFQVVHEAGAAKGELLKRAVAQSTSENIVVLGVDGSDDPRDIDSILIKLREGYDMVVASRFLPGANRYANRPLTYRSLGNRFFSFLLSVLFTRNVTDCNNLFRGFKRSAFERLSLAENGESITFEMTTKALKSDLKFFETPTTEKPVLATRTRRNRFLSAMAFLWILARNVSGDGAPGNAEESHSGVAK
jgi:dTDP-4-amino-4,6-dideoxygalactose transaminase